MSIFDRSDEKEYQEEQDLTTVSTADLVAELCSREGVVVPHPELWYGCIDQMFTRSFQDGIPFPKIIVVRGE